jgi:hypothetical protein
MFTRCEFQPDQLDARIALLRKISGAAELSYIVFRINYEPSKVSIKVCTFDGEVLQKDVYLSWLLRISDQELKDFTNNYLRS